MQLASNLHEVLNNFDFTDSIVTDIKWENSLFDLTLVIDYYWDIQEGRSETRQLKLKFANCVKADFQMKAEVLPLSEETINADSIFTIVLFRVNKDSELLRQYGIDGLNHIELITLDYSKPWLSILCNNVTLETVH
ncbi:hypothetical protein ABU162_29540 [Paenibacillus thiaminolyticus]|uniref:hypothetical protein n=1 Tax=Paenibacillus thiaminolyticus TaxID=49283 RepID=UPI0035A5B930